MNEVRILSDSEESTPEGPYCGSFPSGKETQAGSVHAHWSG